MSFVLASQSLPLQVEADGVIRVAHTRVTLETVIAAFAKGATAEHIAQDYPVVPLIAALDRVLSETTAADWPGQVGWLNQWRS